MTRPPADVVSADVRSTAVPSLGRWTILCAAAEAVGMTAASAAARLADSSASTWARLTVIVAGGLVEGVALGAAQGWALGRWLPALRRGRYVALTVLVAGLGWAGASAPSALSGDDGGAAPPLPLVLLGATGLGLVMGSLLGAAQATALRGAVSRPWRWVAANAAAWPVAMLLIFVGATTPSEDWSLGWVVLVGAVTGVVAGSALGLVSGWFLPSLSGPPAHNRIVLALLESRWHSVFDSGLVALEVPGRRTGRSYRLPVQYAVDSEGIVVVPGHAETKSWWRNLTGRPTPVEVLWRGGWEPGVAEVLRVYDADHARALDTYLGRWPRASFPAGQVLVRIRPAGAGPGNPG